MMYSKSFALYMYVYTSMYIVNNYGRIKCIFPDVLDAIHAFSFKGFIIRWLCLICIHVHVLYSVHVYVHTCSITLYSHNVHVHCICIHVQYIYVYISTSVI